MPKALLFFTEKPIAEAHGSYEMAKAATAGEKALPMPLGQGLRLLQAQQKIYSFLTAVCERLQSQVEPEEVNLSIQTGRLRQQLTYASFPNAVAMAPYQDRTRIDYKRLLDYVDGMLRLPKTT